ncbi:MAG: hypothetical protein ISS59_00550 [Desulfobacteraceae bacterium]|nr:hypothetical protein [Desulfobacteraceae bacterium]
MPNYIFDALIEEKLEAFKGAFLNTAKQVFYDPDKKQLIHPGEFGLYREIIVKNFIKFFIPQIVAIDNGFLITPKDNVSTQCDVIFYYKNVTPLIESGELQRFFPIETVVGVGEVKSTLSKQQFKEALNKLAEIKRLREDIEHPNILKKIAGDKKTYDPMLCPYDNIFTFIICQKLDFNLDKIAEELNDKIYNNDLAHSNRHNLVLSIEDGLLLYDLPQGNASIPLSYPSFMAKGNLGARHIPFNTDKPYHHFKAFAHFLFNGISDATLLYADMVKYLSGFDPVERIT